MPVVSSFLGCQCVVSPFKVPMKWKCRSLLTRFIVHYCCLVFLWTFAVFKHRLWACEHFIFAVRKLSFSTKMCDRRLGSWQWLGDVKRFACLLFAQLMTSHFYSLTERELSHFETQNAQLSARNKKCSRSSIHFLLMPCACINKVILLCKQANSKLS